MRIAVTGASGVLGRGLTARLLSQGHEVVGIARHRPDSWAELSGFHCGRYPGCHRRRKCYDRCGCGRALCVGAWPKRPHQYRRHRQCPQGDGRDRNRAHRFHVQRSPTPRRADAGRLRPGMGRRALRAHFRSKCRQLGAAAVCSAGVTRRVC
ncbi:hypothetical protein TBKG_00410 [Mycobacterium tuberculosis '98-R604 INH-RIF-EM']|nr:hypothetical protein TBKG_00410 [Mycobacterium tuberculosis '98-R604 INH-RIF-EM']